MCAPPMYYLSLLQRHNASGVRSACTTCTVAVDCNVCRRMRPGRISTEFASTLVSLSFRILG